MALAAGNADQSQGEVYGMHFVYSGNFIGQVELGQFDTVRVGMGIHPENFCWKLEKGESFQTPEVVLVYSDTGYDGMTHQFHELYRNLALKCWLWMMAGLDTAMMIHQVWVTGMSTKKN